MQKLYSNAKPQSMAGRATQVHSHQQSEAVPPCRSVDPPCAPNPRTSDTVTPLIPISNKPCRIPKPVGPNSSRATQGSRTTELHSPRTRAAPSTACTNSARFSKDQPDSVITITKFREAHKPKNGLDLVELRFRQVP